MVRSSNSGKSVRTGSQVQPGSCTFEYRVLLGLSSRPRARKQFLSLSQSTTQALPPCQTLVIHPSLYFSSHIHPADPQGQFRFNKLLNRTVSCRHVCDFVSSYPITSWDTIQPSRWETVRWNNDTNITF